MGYKLAVVGATGNVGRAMLEILAESSINIDEVVALASRKSIGKEVSFGDRQVLKVQCLDDYDFGSTDVALFSAGANVSKRYANIAAERGCVVIDNTSFFRMDEDVPLVVPEINSHDIEWYCRRNIIANPNCSTIQMVLALSPLHKIAKIKRVVVSTYQSVSGAGKNAMDELYGQTKGIFMNYSSSPKEFTKQIAFNCIPHIDVFMDDGSTKEEWKMSVETKKILDKNIEVSATCVRVPVFICHAESINVEFYSPISEKEALNALRDASGVLVVDKRDDGGYVTPVDVVRDDAVYVSRIRKDSTVQYGLNMWVVGDNLRKGAALNAVQIAEILVNRYF